MSPVRVLIAAEGYAGLLGAPEAGVALADGWARGAPHDVVSTLPLTDGGAGFVAAVAAAVGGGVHVVTVADPWGRPTPATMLLGQDGATAYIEAAAVCGDQLRRPADDPAAATSAGLGELLLAAARLRPNRIVVGLSGACVLDAGLGVVGELLPTTQGRAVLRGGAAALATLGTEHLADLENAARRLAGVQIVGLGDLHQPLLGLAGVAATHGRSAGATAEQAQHIETALGHAVSMVRRSLPEPRNLLTGAALRLDRRPGCGAGAGLGFGLTLLGADLQDGADAGLAIIGADAALERADLVVTSCAVLGWEQLRAGAGAALAQLAQARGIPTIAVCGRVEAGRRETMAAGFAGTYAVASSLAASPPVAADPVAALAARAAAAARTWSPVPRG